MRTGMLRRSTVALQRGYAMHVNRLSGHIKLVYAILIDKKYKYENGRSRIVYIGTTKNGFSRVAQSAAAWADDIFQLRGVKEFEVRIITCRPRRNLKTWRILERALLLQFREIYGEIPAANTQGKNITEKNEFKVFSRRRIHRILEDLT